MIEETQLATQAMRYMTTWQSVGGFKVLHRFFISGDLPSQQLLLGLMKGNTAWPLPQWTVPRSAYIKAILSGRKRQMSDMRLADEILRAEESGMYFPSLLQPDFVWQIVDMTEHLLQGAMACT